MWRDKKAAHTLTHKHTIRSEILLHTYYLKRNRAIPAKQTQFEELKWRAEMESEKLNQIGKHKSSNRMRNEECESKRDT